MSTWEEQLQQLRFRRHQILEQSGSPTIRFNVDHETCILPYSYLTRAECHVQNDHFKIVATWPDFLVVIEGYHLDQLTSWLAEYRLLSVTLRPEIEEERVEGNPYLERIDFASTVERVDRLESRKLARTCANTITTQ